MSSSTPPVILITGASRGIGAAVVSYLLENSSANLLLISRTAAPLETIKSANPGRVEYIAVDASAPGVSAELVRRALDTFGRLDAVVVSHGVLEPVCKIVDADLEAWREAFELNFFSVVSLTRDCIPELRKTKGRVIFVSSGSAPNGTFSWGAYGAAKAAMNNLNKTLALEEPDITGVAVRPGVVDTQMQFEIRNTHKDIMGKSNERFQELHRTGKILRPEQPGYVIAKLALRADKSLSGQFLNWNSEDLADYQE